MKKFASSLSLLIALLSVGHCLGQGLTADMQATPAEVVWGNDVTHTLTAIGGTAPYSHGTILQCASDPPPEIIL